MKVVMVVKVAMIDRKTKIVKIFESTSLFILSGLSSLSKMSRFSRISSL